MRIVWRRNSRRRKRSWTRARKDTKTRQLEVWIQGLGLLVATTLGLVYLRQLWSMEEAVAAAREQAEQARRQFIFQQRPWIGGELSLAKQFSTVDGRLFDHARGGALFRLRNTGQSPAFGVQVVVFAYRHHDDMSRDPVAFRRRVCEPSRKFSAENTKGGGSTMFPGEERSMEVTTTFDRMAFAPGQPYTTSRRFFLVSCITYQDRSDMQGPTIRQTIGFYDAWLPEGATASGQDQVIPASEVLLRPILSDAD